MSLSVILLPSFGNETSYLAEACRIFVGRVALSRTFRIIGALLRGTVQFIDFSLDALLCSSAAGTGGTAGVSSRPRRFNPIGIHEPGHVVRHRRRAVVAINAALGSSCRDQEVIDLFHLGIASLNVFGVGADLIFQLFRSLRTSRRTTALGCSYFDRSARPVSVLLKPKIDWVRPSLSCFFWSLVSAGSRCWSASS